MHQHDITRRDFLAAASAAGFGALIASATRAWGLEAVTNPLAVYPVTAYELEKYRKKKHPCRCAVQLYKRTVVLYCFRVDTVYYAVFRSI